MSYLLVDDNYKNKLNKIVIETFDKNSFVISAPMTTSGSLIGIKTTKKSSLDDSLEYANRVISNLTRKNINNIFKEVIIKTQW